MSCGRIALSRAGINVDNYYASELDKYAIKVTQDNWVNTVQLGNGWTVDVIVHILKALNIEVSFL